MAISLTEAAAERVRTYLDTRGKGVGLRVGVRKTGCNGFAYVINYADEIEDERGVSLPQSKRDRRVRLWREFQRLAAC